MMVFYEKCGAILSTRRLLPPAMMDEPMDMERTPSPGPPGRSIDIELGSAQEVITIDLDGLDPNPDDVLELLKEGNCKVWMWTKLAGEYWRRGWLDAAEKLALAGVECECLGCLFRPQCVETLLPSIQVVAGQFVASTCIYIACKH
jgi:hypothetical protein